MRHVLILVAVCLTLNVTAQHQKKAKKSEFTSEQIATLKTKRMTLALDLNASQQQKIQELNLENARYRKQEADARNQQKEPKDRLSSDERFAKLNTHLDKAISHKAAMKNILSKEQFEIWESQSHRKARKRKKMMKRRHIKNTRD